MSPHQGIYLSGTWWVLGFGWWFRRTQTNFASRHLLLVSTLLNLPHDPNSSHHVSSSLMPSPFLWLWQALTMNDLEISDVHPGRSLRTLHIWSVSVHSPHLSLALAGLATNGSWRALCMDRKALGVLSKCHQSCFKSKTDIVITLLSSLQEPLKRWSVSCPCCPDTFTITDRGC